MIALGFLAYENFFALGVIQLRLASSSWACSSARWVRRIPRVSSRRPECFLELRELILGALHFAIAAAFSDCAFAASASAVGKPRLRVSRLSIV